MKFTYKLEGVGWAYANLEIGEQRMNFEISYLCDPLTGLLEGLVSLMPNNLRTKSDGGLDDNGYCFTWRGEPWGYSWTLNCNKNGDLHILVESIDDMDLKEPKKQIRIDVTCNYSDFVKIIIDELTLLLKKHGLVGYYETWNSRMNFPITEFIYLKHYVKTQTNLDTIQLNEHSDKLSGTQSSSLEYELELISD